jgi:F0F1-type ATP synthase delta subunit
VQLLPTTKEAALAKQGLRQLRDEYLYKHTDQPVTLENTVRLQELGVTEVLLRWLQSPGGKTALEDFKQAGAEALLQALDKQLQVLPTVRLTLAYHPSTDDLLRFHTWFSQITGKQLLLDVQYDPSLVAGFTAMVGSKFVDASIKDKLPKLAEQVVATFATLPVEEAPSDKSPNAKQSEQAIST